MLTGESRIEPAPQRVLQAAHLTPVGRDRLARQRRPLDLEDSAAGPQRYWHGVGDARQLRHDHHVFDAVCQDLSDVLGRGGRLVRVRLESETRGRLAAAEAVARHREPDRVRKEAAAREGTPQGSVIAGPPDVRPAGPAAGCSS